MDLTKVSPWLIRLIVIVALPTIACSAFYSVSNLSDVNGILAVLVSLAYPALLISTVGLLSQLLSSAHSKIKVTIWSVALVFPLILLLIVWW